ncbi:hypothetical protein ACUYFE_02625 [Olegusella massiliensis]|uniref:hypothetical protein n=1 Tax=Olegusella massiliensis TaxID=1776381 RepID=UPI00405558A2
MARFLSLWRKALGSLVCCFFVTVGLLVGCSGQSLPASSQGSAAPEAMRLSSSLSQTYQYRGLSIKLGPDWKLDSDEEARIFTTDDSNATLSIRVSNPLGEEEKIVADGTKQLDAGERDGWYYLLTSVKDGKGSVYTFSGWGENGAGFTCTFKLGEKYASTYNQNIIEKICSLVCFDPEAAASSASIKEVEGVGYATDQHVDELTIVGFSSSDDGYDMSTARFKIQNNTDELVTFKSIDVYELDADGNIVTYEQSWNAENDPEIAPGQSYTVSVPYTTSDKISSFESKKYSFKDAHGQSVTGVFSKTFTAKVE